MDVELQSRELRPHIGLQLKEALAYSLYMASSTFLPNVVNAVVLFYGGTLVLVGQMSAGALVAFMLYQQSLTSAFQVTAREPDVFL
jgi:ATP-binding cassette subfamily B (MDR/TAP) protein 9